MEGLKKRIEGLEDFFGEAKEDEAYLEDLKEDLEQLKKDIKKEEYRVFLSGKFDKKSAIIEVNSGAGGRDAEDFVAMLLRMYQRYAERSSFKTKVIDASYGESGGPDGRTGIKHFSLQVEGDYAFGFLKKESGAHRLVRKSPFSSADLRHTSFAQVEVFPIIDNNDSQLSINEEDLKIDTFRSSGPGGQHVNKRESAIRVTHIPSGIVVSSQSERLQGENKRIALEILKSKLEQIEEEKKKERVADAKEDNSGANWGNQIRNYVLHPYKLVKDLRTQIETSNVEDVLDGGLEIFKDDFL